MHLMEIDCTKLYPKRVIKFYPSKWYSFDAFLNGYLYLSHPHQLNDMMDCEKYVFDMRGLLGNTDLFLKLRNEIIENRPDFGQHCNFSEVSTRDSNGLYNLQQSLFDSYYSYGGIISLAIDKFNELMWSHYTNESGFAVEYSSIDLKQSIINHSNNKILDKLIFEPIHYKCKPESIDCSKYDIDEINKFAAYQKCVEWSYENEWRMLATSKQYLGRYDYYVEEQEKEFALRKLYYSIDAVKCIYIGKRFWTRFNFVTSDKQFGNENRKRQYTIQEPEKGCEKERYNLFIQFIQKLSELINLGIKVYMSGACDCSEYRHGTDHPTCDKKNWRCEFNPKQYYITRSFDKIENISIKENLIEVTYSGKALTKDCDFE